MEKVLLICMGFHAPCVLDKCLAASIKINKAKKQLARNANRRTVLAPQCYLRLQLSQSSHFVFFLFGEEQRPYPEQLHVLHINAVLV